MDVRECEPESNERSEHPAMLRADATKAMIHALADFKVSSSIQNHGAGSKKGTE
jgi:hypothetical protein